MLSAARKRWNRHASGAMASSSAKREKRRLIGASAVSPSSLALRKEGTRPAVAALSDMVRMTWDDDTSKTGHADEPAKMRRVD